MRTVNEEARRAKTIDIMEKCYDCYAENGFSSVGIKAIADACGCSVPNLYQYFDNLDDLIVKSTEYCMSKVEDEFMAKAPTDVEDLWRFMDEIPYWTAKKHGKKYRLMYQIYTHPKYREYGQKFFKGVDERYTEYAKSLEPKLGIPYEKLTPLMFILVRACVHYALFEDEFYMKSQIETLKETLELFAMKYNPKARSGTAFVTEILATRSQMRKENVYYEPSETYGYRKKAQAADHPVVCRHGGLRRHHDMGAVLPGKRRHLAGLSSAGDRVKPSPA